MLRSPYTCDSNKGECLETFKKLTELLNDSELKKYFVEKRNGLAM